MRCFIKYFFKSNILSHSAQSAFYFLLSLFPFLYLTTRFAVIFSISNDSILDAVRYAFPKNVYNLIVYNFNTLQMQNKNSALVIYILLAMWSSSMFINALKTSLNQNIILMRKKGFIYKRLISIALTVLFAVLISTTLFATLAVNILLGYLSAYLNLDGFGITITKIISFSAVITDLILLYMFLPPERIKFKNAAPGAIFSAFGVLIASNLFSFYINYIANPTVLYGTFGSIVMLMIWLYICSFILISGGLINSFILLKKRT